MTDAVRYPRWAAIAQEAAQPDELMLRVDRVIAQAEQQLAELSDAIGVLHEARRQLEEAEARWKA